MTTTTKKRTAPPREAEQAYTPQQAAKLKGCSYGYVIKAIHSTGEADPKTGVVVPPLAAKRVGKGYRIAASALEDWFSRWADA